MSSASRMAILDMPTSQDAKVIAFSVDCLSIRRGTFILRRDSRTKPQHYRQPNSRVSKRFMPEPGARRNVRITNTVRDAKVVAIAVNTDSEVQITRITTFTPSFDFRYPTHHEKPLLTNHETRSATPERLGLTRLKKPALQAKPVFSTVRVMIDASNCSLS